MALTLAASQPLHSFDAVWARYPNKSSKQQARKVYAKLVTPEIAQAIHKALDWQLPHWQTLEWYHPPYLSTYLNQARYLDEPSPQKTANPTTAKIEPWQRKALGLVWKENE